MVFFCGGGADESRFWKARGERHLRPRHSDEAWQTKETSGKCGRGERQPVHGAYLKEKLEPLQRLSRRRSPVKPRKSQRAAINIANASIIRLTPFASLRWRKCSSAVVFSEGSPSEGLIKHANRRVPARVHAPLSSRCTCGLGLAALPAKN